MGRPGVFRARGSLGAMVLAYAPAGVIPAAVGAFSAMVFTRLLDPSQYGIVALVLAWGGPVTVVASQWAAQASGRFYAEYKLQGRARVYWSAVKMCVLAGLGTSVLLCLLGGSSMFLITPARTWILGHSWLLLGAALGVCMQVALSILLPILPASGLALQYSMGVAGSSVMGFLVAVVGSLAFGHAMTWIVWGPVAAKALALAYVGMTARTLLKSGSGLDGRFREVWLTARQFWHYGSPMLLWFGFTSAAGVVDRYILGGFFGSAVVGAYAVTCNIAGEAVSVCGRPIISAGWPQLAQQWSHGLMQDVFETMRAMTETYLTVVVAAMSVLWFAWPLLAHLLGKGFRTDGIVVGPVAGAAAIWSLSTIGHKALELRGRTKLLAVDAAWSALVNVVLNLGLTRYAGIEGAAISTVGGAITYGTLIVLQTRTWPAWYVAARRLGAIVWIESVALGVAYTARRAFSCEGSLGQLLQVGAFVACYALLTMWWITRERRRVTRAVQ